MGKEVEFEYRPPYLPNFVLVIFFGTSAWFVALEALSNERGLVVNKVISLSAGEASAIYWALALASLVVVGVGLVGIARAVRGNEFVVVAPNELRAPKSALNGRIVAMKYADIQSLHVETTYAQRSLKIRHKEGSYSIPEAMLPRKEKFEELVQLVSEKVNG